MARTKWQRGIAVSIWRVEVSTLLRAEQHRFHFDEADFLFWKSVRQTAPFRWQILFDYTTEGGPSIW